MQRFSFHKSYNALWLSLLGFTCFIYADSPIDIFPSGLFDRVEKEYNKDARERVERWQALVVSEQDSSEKEKLHSVNNFFNTVK